MDMSIKKIIAPRKQENNVEISQEGEMVSALTCSWNSITVPEEMT